MLTESQVWLAEKTQSGFLVALWLPSETAAKIALSGGEPAADLHVTLAICGEASEIPELAQARIITAIADTVMYRDKLEGSISGYGRFNAPEDEPEAQDVFYVTPDIPRLAELRQEIVNCLMSQGVPVNATHGFTPHITLAYLDPGNDNPVSEVEPLPLVFDAVTIMSGSRRVDIPFWEPEPATSFYGEGDLPLDAPVDVHPVRALFGDFDKEWIPFLPKPGKYQRDNESLNLTAETYDQILKNFDNYVYKQDLPIRATHIPSDGGAVGWIRPGGLRLAQDGSIEAKPEWNELGKGLVDDDRFRYVSAEYCKVWTNPVTQEKIPNVAVGLALVTRPHFKTDVLNPLSEGEAKAFAEASPRIAPPTGEVKTTDKTAFVSVSGGLESIVDEVAEGDGGTDMSDTQKLSDQLAPKKDSTEGVDAASSGGASKGPDSDSGRETNPLDPNQKLVLQDLGSVVITAEQRRQERQLFADLESRVELAERRATNAEADLAKIRQTSLKDKFTAEVLGRSAENGRAWFGDPEENIRHLVSLAEKYGEDSPEIRWAVKQKRSEANAIIGTGIFEPIAHQSTDTVATVNAQIQRYAEDYRKADPNLSDEAAIVKAYDEHPDLYLLTIKK